MNAPDDISREEQEYWEGIAEKEGLVLKCHTCDSYCDTTSGKFCNEKVWDGIPDLKAIEDCALYSQASVKSPFVCPLCGWAGTEDDSIRFRAIRNENGVTTGRSKWKCPGCGQWINPEDEGDEL